MRLLLSFLAIMLSLPVAAQSPADSTQQNVPRVIKFSGTLSNTTGTAVVGVTFALYSDQTGGSPLWLETQNVAPDAEGHYSVLLGSVAKGNLPAEFFFSNEARWLGVKAENQDEQPRVLLVSVPYALKAVDAETLGGKPASAYLLAPTGSSGTVSSTDKTASALSSAAITTAATSGTMNFLSKFIDSINLGNSSIYESPVNSNIGIGTTSPGERLEVNGNLLLRGQPTHQFQLIGQASQGRFGQNFYGPFLASDTAGKGVRIYTTPTGGSLTPRLSINSNGYVGIGTTDPADQLEIKGNILLRGSVTHQVQLIGQDSAGRLGQALNGFFFASDTPGKAIRFNTTPSGGALTLRMAILSDGKVGIGVSNPTSMLGVGGVIESTTGGFKFPDGSVLTSAINQGTSTFTGNTINQVLAVTQTGTGTAANFVAQGTGSSAANFTASNSTQTIQATQNGAGVAEFSPSGVPTAVRGDSTASTGSAAGVFGTSSSSLGYGLAGANNAASCDPNDSGCYAIGMFGFSGINGLNGTGVWGEAEAPSGSTVGVFGKSLADKGTGVYGYASSSAANSDATGVYGFSNAANGVGIFGQVDSPTGAPAAVYGFVPAGAGTGALFDVQTGSDLMVGRSGSGSDTSLFTKVFRVDSTGKGYFNNGTQTGGADFAESVSVNGGSSLYHPGDLLIVDETGTRRFALASKAYSTKVAGIYSTKPGVLATPHRDGDPRLEQEVPLAIVGIVPCKVTAENGAIKAGDLLVASSRPGYAMKGTDRKRMLGAVVGKALGSLDKGTGVIEVLVSLH